MSRTGFLFDPLCLRHNAGVDHPENAERLKNTIDVLKHKPIWKQMHHLSARDATLADIQRVHHAAYLENLKDWCDGLSLGQTFNIDLAPTGISGDSWQAAIRAAGASLVAVDAVLHNQVDHAFCAVRPPGHHAIPSRAMGFCLFNNVAVAVRYAQQKFGLTRILIIDWDVHHGNGTQDIFYDDGDVFFFSIHQQGIYPGTGARNETGTGSGKGATLNIPLPAKSDDAVYARVFREELAPRVAEFKPELIFISAGFDCRYRDNNFSQMSLSPDGIEYLTELVKSWAWEHCKGRLVSLLEGGYSPKLLPDSVLHHLNVLLR